MKRFPVMTPAELIAEIRNKLASERKTASSAYALIVGAGFSHGVVPLTKELLHERIGDFYYDQDKTVEGWHERSAKQARKLSGKYWKEFNAATAAAGDPEVELDEKGLPVNPSVAYQQLFTYRTANVLFESIPQISFTPYLDRQKKYREALEPQPQQKVLAGQGFVKEFLQEVLDRGGYKSYHGLVGGEGDWCTTGRNELNAAHFFLASLLELQQSGALWNMRPFCRTIFTTNFDTLLQNALQLVNVMYCVTDRPERGLQISDFPEHDRALHLVYTHGSILRHNAASTTEELSTLTHENAHAIGGYLLFRDVLVFGYGGWEDSLMSALMESYNPERRIYWCNVYPEDDVEDLVAPAVLDLFEMYPGKTFYVPLGRGGSDAFMADLYRALAPDGVIPRLLRDPLAVMGQRLGALKLDNVVFAGNETPVPPPLELPLPKLERSALMMQRSALGALGAARTYFSYESKSLSPDKALLLGRAMLLLEQGFSHALAGEFERAIDSWFEVSNTAKADSESALAGNWRAVAANYIGIVHSRSGREDLAVASHTRALELVYAEPSLEVETLTHRGAAHHRLGEIDLARQDFSRAVAIWEDHPPAVDVDVIGRALIYRGLIHEWAGEGIYAREDLNRAWFLKGLSNECRRLFSLSEMAKYFRDDREDN